MTMDADKAYKLGWEASKRPNHDLEASEARFIAKYGREHWNAWCDGWTDYATDAGFRPPSSVKLCPECGDKLMPPTKKGEPGDDSYYSEGCGSAWSLDLSRRML